jgi:MYXO-CTERM domain-containing protein
VSGILTSTGTTTVTYATPTQTVPGTSSNGSVTTAPVPTVPGDKATATSPTAANTGGGGCNISAGKDAAAAAWLLFLVGGLGLICARRRRY